MNFLLFAGKVFFSFLLTFSHLLCYHIGFFIYCCPVVYIGWHFRATAGFVLLTGLLLQAQCLLVLGSNDFAQPEHIKKTYLVYHQQWDKEDSCPDWTRNKCEHAKKGLILPSLFLNKRHFLNFQWHFAQTSH